MRSDTGADWLTSPKENRIQTGASVAVLNIRIARLARFPNENSVLTSSILRFILHTYKSDIPRSDNLAGGRNELPYRSKRGMVVGKSRGSGRARAKQHLNFERGHNLAVGERITLSLVYIIEVYIIEIVQE